MELKDVKKNYGKKEILKGINLTVQEGEIISVLGPSGCGKSTLLNIIAGILPLNAGQVFVRGKEMSSPHRVVPIEQRDMNMVFQDFALWPHMEGTGQHYLRIEGAQNGQGADAGKTSRDGNTAASGRAASY